MEFDTMDAILAENKAIAQQLTTLNKKLEKLEVAAMSTQAEIATICDLCGGPHENQQCYLMLQDQPLEKEARTNFRNQESSIRNLETQVGKIATQLSTHLPNAFPSDTVVNPTVECNAITIGNGEAFQDSKHEGLNKGNVKGTPTKPLKEEMVINAMQYPEKEDEEWYMRIDVIEELNREVQQEEAMQKFQVIQGRYDVLDDTNQDFVLQEIDAIVQGNIAKMQRKNSAEMQQEHLELQQPRVDELQPNNVKMQ
ncbi:hypothetical protein PIB30_108876, partial [Stylosanthes scabra]|nr:hypothetical protein [Stylosanthes scabra]